MQLLGYAVSAFGPAYIKWFYFEKLLQRKKIRSSTMMLLFSLAAVVLTLQTQFAYGMFLNPATNVLVFFGLTFLYHGIWYQRLFMLFQDSSQVY